MSAIGWHVYDGVSFTTAKDAAGDLDSDISVCEWTDVADVGTYVDPP